MYILFSLQYLDIKVQNCTYIISSVADPDPVGSGLFWSPGSGSGKIPDPDPDPDPLSTKRPHVIQIFSL